MFIKFHITGLISALLFVGETQCQTIQDTQNLMEFVLDGYNRDIRPIADQSIAVQVNVSFDLVAIQEFDEVSETFGVVALMHLKWTGPRMTWNPLMYNSTYSVNLQKDKVWTPELILSNPKGSMRVLGDRQEWMSVRYYSDGLALWSPGDVFYSSCKVDVTYYPFDVQNCELMFLPWGFAASEINLNSEKDEVLLNFFSEDGEWMFKGSRTKTFINVEATFSSFEVEISIKRRAAFFVVNVVIPIIFMSFLNVLVFWVPAESGERVSYAITVLLAIAVFLTIVGDNMPKSSKPMSILSYFLITNLFFSALICVGAIFNSNVYYKHWEFPVPERLNRFTRILISRKQKASFKEKADHVDTETVTANGEKKGNKKISRWAEVVGEIRVGVPRDHKPVTWREVSYAIDKVLGWIGFCYLAYYFPIVFHCYVFESECVTFRNNTINKVISAKPPTENRTDTKRRWYRV